MTGRARVHIVRELDPHPTLSGPSESAQRETQEEPAKDEEDGEESSDDSQKEDLQVRS